ncbi:MAG: methyltransferase domain-containing protein [Desulfobacterales bacterium]
MQKVQGKKDKNRCPVCDSTNTAKFLDVRGVPLFCNVLLDSREEALKAARGDIELVYCRSCGHVYNSAFEPARMRYGPRYENSLHFSPAFREYAGGLARRLVTTYDLRSKDIIEIGCGKGDFLRLLADAGNNRCLGFDPSVDPRRNGLGHRSERFSLVQDEYTEKYSSCPADLIVCRQVLEHIAEPRRFLRTIRRAIGDKPQAVVFVEVPNVMFTLKDFGIWDLIYEHCGYFTASSLRHLFVETDFIPLRISEAFGGQYLCIEAKPSFQKKNFQPTPDHMSTDTVDRHVNGFADRYRQQISKWRKVIAEWRRSGTKTVVWGAGSKGVTFLNVLNIESGIEAVVDVNPHKQGHYVPGTGQRVVSPEDLAGIGPEVIIMMNPLYADEIEKMIEDRQLRKNRDLTLIPVGSCDA